MPVIPLLLCALIGIFAGLIGGLLGVGGGVVMVPAFIKILDMEAHQATATSLAVIVFISIAGSIRHIGLGNLEVESVKIIITVSILAMIGSAIGVELSSRVSDRTLRMIFASFLLFVSVQMFVRAWLQPTPQEISASNMSADQVPPE